MALLNSVVSWIMKQRMHQIELFLKYPVEVQNDCMQWLVSSAKNTEWGIKYDYKSMISQEQFKERVPLSSYDQLKPYIERLRKGEKNILWPQEIKWFAKSSGTTSDKSKFIPMSEDAIEECHFKGGKDLLTLYCNNNPETKIFSGKGLALGGSHDMNEFNNDAFYGDLSAILIQNLPFWAQFIRTPDLSVSLMNEWESKLEKIVRFTINENVTNLSGVPSWMLLLVRRILEISGRDNLLEVWNNLELFVHGGISFIPYAEQFKKIIPSDKMNYIETYNASEGFFGIQDRNFADDMLLMLDYGIFYEFIPMEEFHKEHPQTKSLAEVETDKNYALIISTNAGLWRYIIGDTIKFTSLNPFRFKISGRTKNYINAFGEELMIDNADKALDIACKKTGAVINDYTAAPVYFEDNSNGTHEWCIEFETEPASLDYFGEVFDNALKAANSDYEAKRYHDMILKKPLLHNVPKGTFYNWMKKNNRLGGQYKVPRLYNGRKYIEEILNLTKQ
ncbi:MAG: GH3 auxin-responsive promoter family protein [Bacteroidales bacterium]|nr:GH3 auxin-responsive promoter family protein [Bacteroidales bacterium]